VPGNQADIEQWLQDAAGAQHPHTQFVPQTLRVLHTLRVWFLWVRSPSKSSPAPNSRLEGRRRLTADAD